MTLLQIKNPMNKSGKCVPENPDPVFWVKICFVSLLQGFISEYVCPQPPEGNILCDLMNCWCNIILLQIAQEKLVLARLYSVAAPQTRFGWIEALTPTPTSSICSLCYSIITLLFPLCSWQTRVIILLFAEWLIIFPPIDLLQTAEGTVFSVNGAEEAAKCYNNSTHSPEHTWR